jgi:NADPH:quinone reductase-like Zn-dependent oxidoreductase
LWVHQWIGAEIDLSIAMSKRLRIMGTALRIRSLEEKATATRLFKQHVVPLLASGAVRPVVDQVFKMKERVPRTRELSRTKVSGRLCC